MASTQVTVQDVAWRYELAIRLWKRNLSIATNAYATAQKFGVEGDGLAAFTKERRTAADKVARLEAEYQQFLAAHGLEGAK